MDADPLTRLLGAPPAHPDRDALVAWGTAVGAALTPPAVLTLEGEVGAGKTTLARAVCTGFGVSDPDAVTSPTFALVHEYAAPRGGVVHADLYRLAGPRALDALGWEELVAGAALLLVEWPDRAEGRLPADRWRIVLSHDPESPGRRRLQVLGGPPRIGTP